MARENDLHVIREVLGGTVKIAFVSESNIFVTVGQVSPYGYFQAAHSNDETPGIEWRGKRYAGSVRWYRDGAPFRGQLPPAADEISLWQKGSGRDAPNSYAHAMANAIGDVVNEYLRENPSVLAAAARRDANDALSRLAREREELESKLADLAQREQVQRNKLRAYGG